MKKKGFTLIELLAVLVILGVIMLIAIPTVLDSIGVAKKNAAKAGAYGYIKAAEFSAMQAVMSGATPAAISTGNIANASVKGTKPTSASVTLNATTGAMATAVLIIDGYTITFDATGAITSVQP